jgi:L-malate glycosyltransferase
VLRIKILFIAPSNSIHTKRWIERFVSMGNEAHLFDIYNGSDYLIPAKRHTISPVNRKGLFFDIVQIFRIYRVLRKIVKTEKYDCIHLHWLFHQAPYAATFLKNVLIVATPWGSDVQVPWLPLKKQLKKKIVNNIIVARISKKSSAICCDSIEQRNILINRGADENKIKIIYFGTDIEKFKFENRSEALRIKLGATEKDLLILSNRNHEDIYDIPTFLKAARIALDFNPFLRFVVAGSGSRTNELKEYAMTLGISNKVVFPGRLDDSDFANLSASCDIYVSTSKSDGGLAASTAEAMASKVPVLITNFGENSDWLRGESCGFIFPIGDAEKLATLIIRLSSDAHLRLELGTCGQKIIAEDNNSEIEWKKVINLYNSLSLTSYNKI